MNRLIDSPLTSSKAQRYVLLENGFQFADRRTSVPACPASWVCSTKPVQWLRLARPEVVNFSKGLKLQWVCSTQSWLPRTLFQKLQSVSVSRFTRRLHAVDHYLYRLTSNPISHMRSWRSHCRFSCGWSRFGDWCIWIPGAVGRAFYWFPCLELGLLVHHDFAESSRDLK